MLATFAVRSFMELVAKLGCCELTNFSSKLEGFFVGWRECMAAPHQPGRGITNLYIGGTRNLWVETNGPTIIWVTSYVGSGFLAVSKKLFNMIMLTVMNSVRKLFLKRLVH